MVHVPDRAGDAGASRRGGEGDRIGAARASEEHGNALWEAGVNGRFDAVRHFSHCISVAPRGARIGYGLARRLLRTQFSCVKGGIGSAAGTSSVDGGFWTVKRSQGRNKV